ncbi:MAG: hypothetical protein ACI89X_000251 [Planctomycetota bacterium]|jgi:hypothetical protein
MVIGIVVVGIALVATVAYMSWLAEKKRQEALAGLAQELGLQFDPGLDHGHDDEYAQFEIFRRGHSRVARNTLHGSITLFDRSCHLVAGDYRYKVTSGHGKNRSTRTYKFSYLIVHPPWDTPPLLIRPEGVFDKIKGVFGFDDIDFESAEFSRKFYVKSDDKRFAYDVLHPRMMEFLLATRPPMIDIEDGAICLSDGSRRWDPEQFKAQIKFLGEFCEQWPRHLLKDLNS